MGHQRAIAGAATKDFTKGAVLPHLFSGVALVAESHRKFKFCYKFAELSKSATLKIG